MTQQWPGFPPQSFVSIQVQIGGEGRNDVINLQPVGLPSPLNLFTTPITNPNSPALFCQIPIGLGADFPQTTVGIPVGTRYMIVTPTGGGAFQNISWQQAASDVGIKLSTVMSPGILCWAVPFVSPPAQTYFTDLNGIGGEGTGPLHDFWFV